MDIQNFDLKIYAIKLLLINTFITLTKFLLLIFIYKKRGNQTLTSSLKLNLFKLFMQQLLQLQQP